MSQKKLIAWIILAIIVWFAFTATSILIFGKPSSAAGIGDSFGVVNSLFTALAFAFLIYTSYMQKEELGLQREELEKTREQLAQSTSAHEELVQLTKEANSFNFLINSDKIDPTLHIYRYNFNSEELRFSLQILGKELKITKLSSSHDRFSFSTSGGNFNSRYLQVLEVTADFVIPKSAFQDYDSIQISFESSDGYSFSQELLIRGNQLFIGSVQPDSGIAFFN